MPLGRVFRVVPSRKNRSLRCFLPLFRTYRFAICNLGREKLDFGNSPLWHVHRGGGRMVIDSTRAALAQEKAPPRARTHDGASQPTFINRAREDDGGREVVTIG